MTVRLDGKVALVTGATAGIGRGICVALAGRGAHVLGMARSPEPGALLEKELADTDGSFTFVRGDVNVRADCENAVDAAVAQHGRVDILVNNAGHGFPLKRVEDFEDGDWDTVMSVDLKSTFYMIRKTLPVMQRQRDGVIINIASIVGNQAVVRYGVYGAAKAAVSHLTRALAVENQEFGIRVNSIEMGAVATQHAADVLTDMGRYVHGDPSWTPTPPDPDAEPGGLARALLDPGSVGRSVAVLCSDDAREINGANIPMDGCFAAGFFASTLLHLGAAELLPG